MPGATVKIIISTSILDMTWSMLLTIYTTPLLWKTILMMIYLLLDLMKHHSNGLSCKRSSARVTF